MSYPAYTEYGNAEADWLGTLPKQWTSRRLRFIATEPLMYGANEAAVLDDKELPRYIRITDVKGDGTLHDDTFRSLDEDVAAPYLLEEGDILLARSGATVGKSFQYLVSWGRAAYAGYLIRCRPDQNIIFPRFANYYFQTECYWACIRSTLIQATIENFSAEKYKDLKLPLPPKAEQQQIAAFLDWKTGQIDALIVRKRELLEKLKEKRIAVITQAVTKGLNPAALMRDSGIPWLGQVPQHWDVPALKFRYNVELGKMLDEKRITGEHPVSYLRNVDVQWDKINYEDLPVMDITQDEYPRYTIKENDVLVCEGGEVGRSAVAGAQEDVIGFQKAIHRLRADAGNELPKLLYYTLLWAVNTGVFSVEGASTIAHLTADQLRRYRFPRPPRSEQLAVVAYLDKRVGQIKKMTAKVESAIDRLTEYRAALITAATTGKIDVRNVKVSTQGQP